MGKVYVVEERNGFKGWKPESIDTIKKGANSRIALYREISKIYKLGKYYRIKVYIPLEDKK